MIRHIILDDLPLNTQMRYTKNNWTASEITELMMGTSNSDRLGEVRWSKFPNPETNQ